MLLPCHHQQCNKLSLLLKLFLGRMAPTEVLNKLLQPFCPFHLQLCVSLECSIESSFSALWYAAGAQKLARIRENSNFFRSELKKMGFEVLGDNDSPVMPIMLYNPAKIPAFSRECLRQKVSSRVHCYIPKIQIALCFWYSFLSKCHFPWEV